MRYLSILKGNKATEGYVPSKEDAARMGALIEQAMKDGWLLATEGLQPSAKASLIRVAAGKTTIIDGPFTESKELIASYALLKVGSKQEAIEHCQEFLNYVGGGEIELWQLYEDSDFA
jgi:hypothetical protein